MDAEATYRDIEQRMFIAGRFFSEYFRRTLVDATVDAQHDFTLLELKGLGAFVDMDREYTMGALSANAFMSMSNMTAIVKRFERRGVVRRRRASHDRRIVLVSLTNEGRHLRREFMAMRARELERTLGTLSRDEQRQLFNALGQATAILRKIPAADACG